MGGEEEIFSWNTISWALMQFTGEGSRVQSLALPNECEILIAVLDTSKHAITGTTDENDLTNGNT